MLTEHYQKIDVIDAQLAALFEARMQTIKQIATVKHEQGIGLTDIQREKAVLDARLAAVEDPALEAYVKDLYQTLILISKQYQARLMKAMKEADEK
ncbi:chorismate mutase [Lactobacillus curvatus]|nr:chorismate mutase [Latilactobacillus curvatus]MSE24384.1 chorismate mutase [Latilactobacillus curvatus]